LVADEDQTYHQALHPAVGEAISRLAYPRNVVGKLAAHIAGTHSLRRAPAINHATLAACGITPAALEKIEAYLPCVNTVRLAITPWIVGVEFCVSTLKIERVILEAAGFDLLSHLGFTATDIVAADRHCYGFGTARNAKLLQLRHRPLFACGTEVSVEARIRIASAVQSFISGDTGLTATLPAQHSAALGAEATLSAWRRGLKSLTIVFDPAIAARPARKSSAVRQIKAATLPHALPMGSVSRVSQGKKSAPVDTTVRSGERRTRGH
jgi:ribonucleoside-diphosphate reductase alpha chain